MIFNRYGKVTWPLAALAMFTGVAMAAPAPVQSPMSTVESREGAKLLRDIRMDARQVRTHAWRSDMLAKRQTAMWYKFDRQWNEIKPPVEDMSIKLVRLQEMSANLPAWEQKAIADSQPLIARIASETHDYRTELNERPADLTHPPKPALAGDARILARDAGRLVRAAERPGAAQAPMAKNS